MNQKTVKYYNLFKGNLLFFILELYARDFSEGMYLILKSFLGRKNSYVPVFIERNVLSRGKSESHI